MFSRVAFARPAFACASPRSWSTVVLATRFGPNAMIGSCRTSSPSRMRSPRRWRARLNPSSARPNASGQRPNVRTICARGTCISEAYGTPTSAPETISPRPSGCFDGRWISLRLARAYAASEEAFFFQWVGGYADTGQAAKSDALRLAEKAVELDGQDAFNRYAWGRALILVRRHESAVFELRKAIELDPSFAQAYYALAMALGHRRSSGRGLASNRDGDAAQSARSILRTVSGTKGGGFSFSWGGWRRRSRQLSARCANRMYSGPAGQSWLPHRLI